MMLARHCMIIQDKKDAGYLSDIGLNIGLISACY
jgi:hypothetical protein